MCLSTISAELSILSKPAAALLTWYVESRPIALESDYSIGPNAGSPWPFAICLNERSKLERPEFWLEGLKEKLGSLRGVAGTLNNQRILR
jgi:hypothetical protein